MTQARKTLELRIEFLVDAMSECHMAVATRKRWKEIEASMDAVEIAWDRIRRTSSEFVSHAGLNLDHLPMMVEMVLTKAEKYLAKAQAKMEKWWEAQVQAWEAEKASEQSRETSYEMPCDDEDRGKELNAEVNEVAPEVSAVNKVNEVEPEVSNVNKVNEVNVSEVNVSKVNVNAEEVKFDVKVEAKVEVFGMKEVKNLKDDNKVEVFDAEVNNGKVRLRLISKKAEVEQSRPAKWDPGQLFGAKDQMEMLNVEEAEILVNINKVGLQLFMKEVWSSGGAIEKALLIVMFLLKERFVNSFSPLSVIELSEYG